MKKIFTLLVIFLYFGIGIIKAQYKVLLSFNDTNSPQGNFPLGNLTISGNVMYGVTTVGGIHKKGNIFSVSTSGTNYKDLFDFNGTNGYYPEGTLTLSGNILYGTTYRGGASDSGLIFSIHTDGTGFKILTQFNNINAANPYGKLVLSGNKLFGKLQYGGANGDGCVFSVDTNGTSFKNLFSFLYAPDPWPVIGSLIISGNTLYGMTFYGGTLHYGNIFSIDTNGSGYVDVYDFNEGYGDAYPFGSLILSGNTLYGMTSASYCYYIYGNIFSVKTNGTGYKGILQFSPLKGAFPTGDLTLLGGTLYGMTADTNTAKGCVFSIDTSGTGYTRLVNFNGTNGEYPMGSLTFSGNLLYGMTPQGGTHGDYGVIFSYNPNITGVNTIENKPEAITLFPNPNNGVFTIQSSVVSRKSFVEIYNVLGEQVYLRSAQADDNNVNLSNQPNGIYLYRVMSENGELLGDGKFVIAH